MEITFFQFYRRKSKVKLKLTNKDIWISHDKVDVTINGLYVDAKLIYLKKKK